MNEGQGSVGEEEGVRNEAKRSIRGKKEKKKYVRRKMRRVEAE